MIEMDFINSTHGLKRSNNLTLRLKNDQYVLHRILVLAVAIETCFCVPCTWVVYAM